MLRFNLFEEAQRALQDALFIGAKSLQEKALQATTLDELQKLKGITDGGKHLLSRIETTVLPAVAIYEPAVADALLQQYRQVTDCAQKLEDAFLHASGPELRILYYKFLGAHLQCMRKNEEILNPLLWYYYSDKELREMELPLQGIAYTITERQAA